MLLGCIYTFLRLDSCGIHPRRMWLNVNVECDAPRLILATFPFSWDIFYNQIVSDYLPPILVESSESAVTSLYSSGLCELNMIHCSVSGRTEVERWVLLAGVVVDVGDAEWLDGDGSDTQQQLTQQQQRVHHLLGGALLLAAALIGGWGGKDSLWLAEARTVITGGCWEREEKVSLTHKVFQFKCPIIVYIKVSQPFLANVPNFSWLHQSEIVSKGVSSVLRAI